MDHVLDGKRIGVFGKGGCGKSTVTVLLAKALRARGYETVVVDADSTNVGLSVGLGVERTPLPLIDYFGGTVFSGGSVTCPVDDPTPLAGAVIDLDAINADYVGRTGEGIFLLTAGKLGELGPGAGCDGPITKIARDLRLRVRDEDPVTLLDFKAGLEDSARGAVTAVDWAIVVIDPTTAAIRMAFDMQKTIGQLRNGAGPATRHLDDPLLVDVARKVYRASRIHGAVFVINKVADRQTESYLSERLARRGIRPSGVFRENPSISRGWLRGEPLDWTGVKDEALRLALALERAPGRAGGERRDFEETRP